MDDTHKESEIPQQTDIIKNIRWLKRTSLKTGTEGLIIITLDQSQPIRDYEENFIKKMDET